MERLKINKAEDLPDVKELFERLPQDLQVGMDPQSWWIGQIRPNSSRDNEYLNELADYATSISDNTTTTLKEMVLNSGYSELLRREVSNGTDNDETMQRRGIFQQWLCDIKAKLESKDLLIKP